MVKNTPVAIVLDRSVSFVESEIGNLAGLQLKLQFVSDKGDKFRIRGFSLGVADGIAEKSL